MCNQLRLESVRSGISIKIHMFKCGNVHKPYSTKHYTLAFMLYKDRSQLAQSSTNENTHIFITAIITSLHVLDPGMIKTFVTHNPISISFIFYNTSNLIAQFLPKRRNQEDVDQLLSRAGVEYMILCSYQKEYIGETKRALGTCSKEHQAVTRWEEEKSAVVEHVWAEQYHPPWDEVSLLQQADRDDISRIKEAFCITTVDHWESLNRDWATVLSDCWKPLLRCWQKQCVARQPH